MTDSRLPSDGFGTVPNREQLAASFLDFVDVVARLRAPGGCPWDRQQTLESIRPYTLEETYELLEAIDAGDDRAIAEELGDVLLQVVLDAQIGRDERRFDLLEVVRGVRDKIIRRHPHVFGNETAADADEVRRHWDAAKRAEPEKPDRQSGLDGIPAAMPSLARAVKLTARAARVGYDFPRREMLFDKLREELAELHEELDPSGTMETVSAGVEGPVVPDEPLSDESRRDRAEAELGDVLFVLANVARRWGLDPETALRRTNAKFTRRFVAIEKGLRDAGLSIEEATLGQMEAYYQQAKAREKSSADPPTA